MSHSTQNPDSKLIENETQTQYSNSFFFEFPCMIIYKNINYNLISNSIKKKRCNNFNLSDIKINKKNGIASNDSIFSLRKNKFSHWVTHSFK